MSHRRPLRKLACLLMASLYTSFLCCQVTHNIASATNDPFKLLSNAAVKTSSQFRLHHSLIKKHAGLVVKTNTRPTKRFHPQTGSMIAIAAEPAPVFYPSPVINPRYQSPFLSSLSLYDQLLRGPPCMPEFRHLLF
jgi:hypothetical protein